MFNKDKDHDDKGHKDKDDKDKAKPAKDIIVTIPTAPALQLTEPQLLWWRSFDAASQGMWSNANYSVQGRAYIVEQAKLFAVEAHGAYPEDPPAPPPPEP